MDHARGHGLDVGLGDVSLSIWHSSRIIVNLQKVLLFLHLCICKAHLSEPQNDLKSGFLKSGKSPFPQFSRENFSGMTRGRKFVPKTVKRLQFLIHI